MLARRAARRHVRQPTLVHRQPVGPQLAHDRLVQRRHAVVVEARRDRAVDRHFLGRHAEQFTVALVLLAHVAKRILRTLAIELVDGDEVGEVEHVDLLELRRGAELRRHHVERDVDVRDDRGVTLADAGRLDDHEIEPGRLARGHGIGERLGDLAAGVARRERAHVDVRRVDRVHPDSVAQERTAGLAARRVDRHDRDFQAVPLIEPKTAHQLVGERALAGAAGTGDSEHRRLRVRGGIEQRLPELGRRDTGFQCGDRASQPARACVAVAIAQRLDRLRNRLREVGIRRRDDFVDHALQPEPLPVLGREDARHAVIVQRADFGGYDDAAAAAENLDVACSALAQQVEHVREELDVPALIR